MKSKQFLKTAAIFGFFLLALPNLSKAQAQCSGYTIANTSTGTIKVGYRLDCGTLLCFSSGTTAVAISPGAHITLPDCDACDCSGVKVVLKAVDATTMNVSVSQSQTTATYTSSTCNGSINWTSSTTTIH